MELKIQSQIVDYFTYLRKSYAEIKMLLIDCRKTSQSLFDTSESLKCIQKANILGTPLEKFQAEVDKLCYNSTKSIGESLTLLKSCGCDIDKIRDALIVKKQSLEKSCAEINFSSGSSLIDGTALQPNLSDLLEYSQDGVIFFQGISAQVKIAISSLSVGSGDVLKILNEAFKLDEDMKIQIEVILSLTQFCSNNEV